jgi:hypothetical protein
VVDFVVQLEVLFEGVWRPVVRYDMAHGAPHVDRYETPTVRSKEALQLAPAAAVAHADRDVNKHWERYRDDYVRRNAR